MRVRWIDKWALPQNILIANNLAFILVAEQHLQHGAHTCSFHMSIRQFFFLAQNVSSWQVSAANYNARPFGVRAGMPIGEAKRLCPNLLVVPYMFEKYAEVSEQVSLL
jgi:hypothetical protein